MRYLHSIPVGLLVSILIVGFLIYILFLIIEKYYITFVKQKDFQKSISKYLPKVKLFSWFIWFIVAVYFLLLKSPLITLVFLIGIYLFTKDFWLNIYSGIFLMNKVEVGDYIEINSLKINGVIKKMRFSDVELENENKEIVFVPNALLVKATIIKKEEGGTRYRNVFVSTFIEGINAGFNEKDIESIVLNCPWTVISKPVDIDFVDDNQVRICAYTFSKDSAIKQEYFVKKRLNYKTR